MYLQANYSPGGFKTYPQDFGGAPVHFRAVRVQQKRTIGTITTLDGGRDNRRGD
jgi:hypothetical protein